ncbi:TetR family transcriptional regulator [Leucobacter triazinivorans]|uniref:TetR family transcriptional regulator n=1 Tax=Leucobacter triazinivorans TaxID=1784719 RepID=UPI0013EEA889|nr:TetR/AcrR family transcriptional regulator [Leucobacter triazinivorans]
MTERRARRPPGENRSRLLEAGLIEFGLFGFSAASTSAIAARAEMSQPHLYASFATKRDLFLACFAFVLDELREPVSERDQAHRATLLRFLVQCVASSHVPGMREPLTAGLLELGSSLGESRFAALLAEGSHALIDAP